MPIIQILGLPNDVADTPQLEELKTEIIPSIVAGIPELGLARNQVTTFTPQDLPNSRIGKEIIIIIIGLFVGPTRPTRTFEVRQALCDALKRAMVRFAHEYVQQCSLIEVFPQSQYDDEAFAAWRREVADVEDPTKGRVPLTDADLKELFNGSPLTWILWGLNEEGDLEVCEAQVLYRYSYERPYWEGDPIAHRADIQRIVRMSGFAYSNGPVLVHAKELFRSK